MYICILMYSDIFASGLLFTETTKYRSHIVPLGEGLLRTRISSY